ncbi:MAG: superoxide dismutase family protein [Phycisphaerales bacterium]
MRSIRLSVIAVCAVVLLGGCATTEHANQWEGVNEAVAVIHSTEGHAVSGVVRFTDAPNGVRVVARVEGLNPNQLHGFHIHEFGDCTAPDGTSAGDHYDPIGSAHHAKPNAEDAHHAGDLGNLQANAQGVAEYDRVIEDISVAGLMNPIIGRSVIIHAEPDSFIQPTGGAGGRIACGVIGVANPGSN